MSATFPRTIKVGAHKVRLKRGRNDRFAKKEGCDGYSEEDCSAIWVNPRLGPTRTVEILFHEVLHIMLYPTALNVKQQEQVCRVLSDGLTALFHDNPKLFDAIRKRLRSK